MAQVLIRQRRHHHRLLIPVRRMKKYATTWLLIASIVIAEAHSYLPYEYAMKKENWIYSVDRTMEIQWNVKYLADQVNAVLYFVAMFFYNRNKVNKTTVLTFIILCIIDLGMYLHNYKTLHYGSVYVWTLGVWTVIYYRFTLMNYVKIKTVLLCHKLKAIITNKSGL